MTSTTSLSVAPARTSGSWSPRRIMSPTFIKRRPSEPPGWKRA
jgi:hypothetical protein